MLALKERFLSMCRSSRAIVLSFNSKTQWQMFLLPYGRHVCVSRKDTNMASPLYKFWWHTANNARMKNSRDLILGKVVYISIIYRISDSWLFSIEWLRFLFWSHDWCKPRIVLESAKYSLPLKANATSILHKLLLLLNCLRTIVNKYWPKWR